MVLDFKLPLNIRQTTEWSNSCWARHPIGHVHMMKVLICFSGNGAFCVFRTLLCLSLLCRLPSGSYAWLSTLVQLNSFEGGTAKFPVPGWAWLQVEEKLLADRAGLGPFELGEAYRVVPLTQNFSLAWVFIWIATKSFQRNSFAGCSDTHFQN